MQLIITIIAAIIIFSLLIFVHELGHFLAARWCGVYVHEFAIGMGPAIWKKQKGETLYSIRCVPIGGYCKMEGEDAESDDPRALFARPWWAKCIILVAGGFMNVLLGFVICLIMVVSSGPIAAPVVDSALPDAPAASFLQPGDRIMSINGSAVHISGDVSFERMIGFKEGQPFELTINRGGKTLTQSVLPYVMTDDSGNKSLLVGFNLTPEPLSFSNVLHESFFSTILYIKEVYVSLWMLITGQVSLSNMMGPIGVVTVIGGAVQTSIQTWSMQPILWFASLIAVNLGIFNLLPFPALDGGRVVFALAEGITRRRVKPEHEGVVHLIGFALLILLIVVVSYNDILRFFTGGY